MPRPKQYRNEVLHIDERAIVYRKGWPDLADEDEFDPVLIRERNHVDTSLLLKIGTNETDPLQPIAEYVRNSREPWGSCEEGDDYRSSIPAELRKRLPCYELRSLSTRSILKRARIIHFTARLALCAMGDERSYGVLTDEGGETYSCTIPLGGKMYNEWLRPELLDLEGTVQYMILDFDKEDVTVAFTGAERAGISGAAGYLLASLANIEGFNKYMGGVPSPVVLPDVQICEEIIRSARDGSLIACPACGWPVIKLSPKSSPVCRHSHLNMVKKRGRIEVAKAVIEKGGTIAEAAKESGLTYGQVEYRQRHGWGKGKDNGQEEVTRVLRDWFGFRHHLD